MKRNRKNLLHLHADITAYAASKLADYGLPRCDLGDIVSEAYLKAQAKMTRHMPRTSRNALFKAIAWCAVFDELDRRNRISVLHDKHDLRLDAPKRADEDESHDELEEDGFAIGDGGKGAEDIRSFDENGVTPEWVYECRAREKELSHKPRDIVRAFKTLWDPTDVMKKVGLKEKQFGAFLKKVQIHFDQCFRAYHAWLAEKSHRVG